MKISYTDGTIVEWWNEAENDGTAITENQKCVTKIKDQYEIKVTPFLDEDC